MKLMFKDTNNVLRTISCELEDGLELLKNQSQSKQYIKEQTGIEVKGPIMGLVK